MRVISLDPGGAEDRAAVRCLQFHPAGRLLAAVVGDPDHFRDLCKYDLVTDTPIPAILPDESAGFTPAETGPDPVASRDLELVAVGVLDYEGFPAVAVIDTWSQEQTEFWFRSSVETISFPAMVFSTNNTHFYAATTDTERRGIWVRGWNLDALFDDDAADAELDPVRRPADLTLDELPTALTTDPADRFIAVGTNLGAVWLIDVRRERPPRKLISVAGAVRSVAFAADGTRLVVVAQAVTLVQVRDGQRLARFTGSNLTAALAPDGHRLALADDAGTLTLYDLTTEQHTHLSHSVEPLSGLAFAPDGLTVATGGPGGQVTIWDV